MEKQYLDVLRKVLISGQECPDRTGTGITKTFGEKLCFDLRYRFPLLTTKHVYFQGVVDELLWFISGSTNVNDLQLVPHWWRDWADKNGDLGPIYGYQLRAGVDQLQQVIDQLRTNPYSRRHVISLWDHNRLEEMALPPCHGVAIQFDVEPYTYAELVDICIDERDLCPEFRAALVDYEKLQRYARREELPWAKLNCQMYQRSADLFLGVPVNIASYSLLTHMIAQVVGMDPGMFIHIIGNAHIYDNHKDQVRTQLDRTPFDLPMVKMSESVNHIDDFCLDDFKLIDYNHHPKIKAPLAV